MSATQPEPTNPGFVKTEELLARQAEIKNRLLAVTAAVERAKERIAKRERFIPKSTAPASSVLRF